MRLSPSEIFSRLNSSYWFVPLVVTLAGLLLAVMLLLLDSRVRLDPNSALSVLRPSSAEGARALLSAVIGAMITAISITFSVTIVALTVAAQHFGPRVLSSFVRQTSAQVVLGTFLATFAYSVLALGAIRGTGADADIPELTVSGVVVLVVISIGALIYYVHHISTVLQVGELAAGIALDLRTSAVRQEEDAAGNADDEQAAIPDAPLDACHVVALESGYVQRIDYDAVVEAAGVRGAVVWIRREPGAFLLAGTPMALVHPPEVCDDALAATLRTAFIVGRDRTLWHDPEFALKQLVEIALRALSPGVNEPFTAMTCIDRLTEGLASVATTPPTKLGRRDADGRIRVWVLSQPFSLLIRAAFDPIRIFAGPNPAIYTRLLDSIAELSLIVRDEQDRQRLREQADMIHRAAQATLKEAEDRSYVDGRYRVAAKQLEGIPVSSRR